jgi:hypothetical protein
MTGSHISKKGRLAYIYLISSCERDGAAGLAGLAE